MPAEALDGLRRRSMILADNLTPLSRIEMAGDFGRADEITEETVRCRRSPVRPLCGSAFARLGAAVSSGAAHCAQNLASNGFSKAHF
jgi:hypothetical protein